MEKKDLNLDKERNNLVQFIWEERKPIIIITSVSFVVAVIISLLLTPLYLSTAIVFPAASSNVSFSEQRNVKAAAMDFGEEEQAEQLVQILQSSRIRDKVVSKYNLLNHYEISKDDVNKNYKLIKAYNSYFSFTRTRFGSIQIDVLDKETTGPSRHMASMKHSMLEWIKLGKFEGELPLFDKFNRPEGTIVISVAFSRLNVDKELAQKVNDIKVINNNNNNGN